MSHVMVSSLSVGSLAEGIKVIVAGASSEREEDSFTLLSLQYNPVHGLIRL